MSHYFGAVVVPPGTSYEDAEKHVGVAMEPYDENLEVEQRTEDGETYGYNPKGKWDWWQIGGRWTGVWSDYDPTTDLTNVETCNLCQGSGLRNDRLGMAERLRDPEYTCNGCQGKGARVKWPTSWANHAGDLIPVSALLENPKLMRPHSLVIPEGGFYEREWWVPGEGEFGGHFEELSKDDWQAKIRELLDPLRKCSLVVVDYHS